MSQIADDSAAIGKKLSILRGEDRSGREFDAAGESGWTPGAGPVALMPASIEDHPSLAERSSLRRAQMMAGIVAFTFKSFDRLLESLASGIDAGEDQASTASREGNGFVFEEIALWGIGGAPRVFDDVNERAECQCQMCEDSRAVLAKLQKKYAAAYDGTDPALDVVGP